MNTDFKINGQSYRFATSAENVKYGSGTVKDALDNITSFDTSGMSEFGKKLYAADEKEFKRLLEISSEGIWDECQTRWYGTANVTDDTTAHGGKVLSLAGTNLQTAAPIEFGGDPFTISFYAYVAANKNSTVFRALGQTSSFGLYSNDSNYWGIYYGTTAINNYTAVTLSGLTGAWKLIKFSYASGKLNLSVSGNSTKTHSMTIAREPRRLFFGAFTGYIDDFELVDNGVVKSKLNFE